jgi:seryl-tRNA synthetase
MSGSTRRILVGMDMMMPMDTMMVPAVRTFQVSPLQFESLQMAMALHNSRVDQTMHPDDARAIREEELERESQALQKFQMQATLKKLEEAEKTRKANQQSLSALQASRTRALAKIKSHTKTYIEYPEEKQALAAINSILKTTSVKQPSFDAMEKVYELLKDVSPMQADAIENMLFETSHSNDSWKDYFSERRKNELEKTYQSRFSVK